jgi:hypothetical protein
MGNAAASANARDIIEFWDLPVTKGLQESMHEFEKLDEEVELQPILDELAALPPLDRAYSDEIRERIPALVGGMSVALGRAMKIIDTKLVNPSSTHWERAQQVFDLLL